MTLTPLSETDIGAALALSDAERWNKTAADWRRITELAPSGCFVARAGERVVGTVTTTTYEHTLAWIGMMIVHPDFRRHLDHHLSGPLDSAALAQRGLSKRRNLTRMWHGQPNDAGDPRWIAASAGPEFG